MMTMNKRSPLLLTVFLFLICLAAASGMEILEHRKELGVLKEHGRDEEQKEKELERRESAFQGVRNAIKGGQLTKGASSRDVEKKYDRPAVSGPEGNGEEWIYFGRSSERLRAPRVHLYFSESRRLERWECHYADCDETL
jgi:hypothetical protein